MKAKVISVDNLLDFNDAEFFANENKHICIPKYQREYKWGQEKIKRLITDIHKRDKFLGIITLDEKEGFYEVVDGQQRLTTIMLMLMSLYNYFKMDDLKENFNQSIILSKMMCDRGYVLKNQSIGGEFLLNNESEKKIELNITEDDYEQTESFQDAIKTINQYIDDKLSSETKDVSYVQLEELFGKIMNCKILMLINDNSYQVSTEEVYVDINHKSQRLDVEDIFKGYCFQKVHFNFHNLLRERWSALKKNGFYFKNTFGYKDFSDFLYIFFLNEVSDINLTEKLELNGEHVLEDKSMTQVLELTKKLEKYGNNIKIFYSTLSDNDDMYSIYLNDYNNQVDTIKYLKECMKKIMKHPEKYQKLPFFTFINFIDKVKESGNKISIDSFQRIITNYYIYSVIFSRIMNQKRSKKVILFDHINMINQCNEVESGESVKEIKRDIKQKYKNILSDDNHVEIKKKYDYEASIGLYSIIDNYNNNEEKIKILYTLENRYNDEHFIIHEKNKVVWKDNEFEHKFSISEFSKYKGNTSNRMILEETLNGSIKSFDVVYKVEYIKSYYNDKNKSIPKHIGLFIDHVEALETYTYLKDMKLNNETDKTIIEEKYSDFITDYFSDEKLNQIDLLKKIYSEFYNVITNN